MPLIEKAIAKLLGGYHRLVGGHASYALTLLTGFPCELLTLPEPISLFTCNDDNRFEFWLKILSYNSAKYLMTVSCGRDNSIDYKRLGLLKNHAYSILDIISIENVQLIKYENIVNYFINQILIIESRLQNPWGTRVWKGNWSEQCTLWNTIQNQELKPKNCGSAEDGIFWISFNDLCKYFQDFIVCKVQPNWFSYDFEGQFPLRFSDTDNRYANIFELKLQPETEQTYEYGQIMATLYRTEVDNFQEGLINNTFIFIVIFKLLSSKNNYVVDSFVSSSVCHNKSSATCEAELKQGQRYLLAAFVLNNNAETLKHFLLKIYSSKPLQINKTLPNPGLCGDLILHYVLACGKQNQVNVD